jgi:ferredoxin
LMTRRIQIISQLFFFALFCVFLVFVNRPGPAQRFSAEWFLQLNPLPALLASVASRAVVWSMVPGAIILTIGTILFGRFFCGFVCPLGAAIDFSDRYLFKQARNQGRRPPAYMRRIKYLLLIALFVLACLGTLFPLFMDPISLITRMAAVLVEPCVRTLAAVGVDIKTGFASGQASQAGGSALAGVVWVGSLVTAVLCGVIFAGGFWDRRAWCQYICPSGALFGLLSRFAFLRRRVNTVKCNSCRVCATRQCPTRAIDLQDAQNTSTAECILCGTCTQSKRDCGTIAVSLPAMKLTHGPNLARRHFVAGILAGVAAVPLVRAESTAPPAELIRPPGALPEPEFLTRCLACGECIKACPNHALGTCGLADGFVRLCTPKLVPAIGYCEPGCTVCTHVCPTVALRPISREDKPFVKVGTAMVDRDRCLAWLGINRCMVCKKSCPYQAIEAGELNDSTGPVVDKDLCTGCGKCENVCPVKSTVAIQIQAYGEYRTTAGPAFVGKKRERIAEKRAAEKDEK